MKLPGDIQPQSDRKPIFIAAALFSVLSIWMAVASNGFLEADSITHYLARRFALSEPAHLVSVWTRPLCVILYAIPAYVGGIVGTRLMSLALVIAMLAAALAVNRTQNFTRPAFVAIFLLTQPLLFAHSFSELTEIPFALLLLLAFLAYQRKQFFLLAILAAISPWARPEGFGLILVTAVALWAHRGFEWTLFLPVGLIFWSYAGWNVYGGPSEYPWWRWLTENWPYSGDSVYGSGSPFRFVMVLPAIIGPMAFPFMWIGAARAFFLPKSDDPNDAPKPGVRGYLERAVRRFLSDHAFRCQCLIALVPLGILAVHSVLWAFGKMASNGEPRYMLIVAPFWALLAARGYEWTCEVIEIRRPLRWTVLAAIAPIAAHMAYPVFPIGPAADDRLAKQVVAWLKSQDALREQYPMLAAGLPHLFVQLDLDKLDKRHIVDSSQKSVANPPPGVIFVWDPVYSVYNSDERFVVTEDMLKENGWTPIERFDETSYCYAVVYRSPSPK